MVFGIAKNCVVLYAALLIPVWRILLLRYEMPFSEFGMNASLFGCGGEAVQLCLAK